MPSPGQPVTILSCPVEVLRDIIGYLSPQEAIALSYTCKAAHSLPLDPALHTVVLDKNIDQIHKFRDYLLATNTRPGYLASLVLAKPVTWEIEQDTSKPANALADILEKAGKLQSFNCGSMEVINRASGERVNKALVALTKLQEVNVRNGGIETINAILSMNSLGLQTLSVSLQCSYQGSYATFFEPLARYTYLHTLSMTSFWGSLPDSLQLQNTISIPSVRSLTIQDTTIPLWIVASIFPNVEHISYRSGRRLHDRIVPMTNPLVPDVSSSWTHTLASARLDVADVDIWPFSCRVNWLDLGLMLRGHSPEALFLVGQAKPRVFSCAYRMNADNLLWVNLRTVATDLRFLEARIIELSGHRKRYVLMHLAGLDALTAVSLSIRAFYQPDDIDAELTSIARDLARANRQLRFVGISLVDGRSMRDDDPVWNEERLASRWWVIHRLDPSELAADLESGDFSDAQEVSRLVPIQTEVGLKVRKYMYEADHESPGWQDRLSAISTV